MDEHIVYEFAYLFSTFLALWFSKSLVCGQPKLPDFDLYRIWTDLVSIPRVEVRSIDTSLKLKEVINYKPDQENIRVVEYYFKKATENMILNTFIWTWSVFICSVLIVLLLKVIQIAKFQPKGFHKRYTPIDGEKFTRMRQKIDKLFDLVKVLESRRNLKEAAQEMNSLDPDFNPPTILLNSVVYQRSEFFTKKSFKNALQKYEGPTFKPKLSNANSWPSVAWKV